MAQTTRRSAAFGSDPKPASGRPSQTTERPGRATRLGADFEGFVSALRLAIMPASPLEKILADRLILAAWRLQLASTLEFDAALAGDDLAPLCRETSDAEQSLGKTLELLEASRAARLGRDVPTADEPEPCPFDPADDADPDTFPYDEADLSNEWPTLPGHDEDDKEEEEEEKEKEEEDRTPAVPRWQDRLVFDFSVSETSPVVKGTWVTVGHVVSLIVDGWTWSDVLRTHPELTEDDIRTCLSYSVEHDNGDGY